MRPHLMQLHLQICSYVTFKIIYSEGEARGIVSCNFCPGIPTLPRALAVDPTPESCKQCMAFEVQSIKINETRNVPPRDY